MYRFLFLALQTICTVVALPLLTSSRAVYHDTDTLLDALRHKAFRCPHASAQWATVVSSHDEARSLQPSRMLMITVSANLSTAPAAVVGRRPVILASFGEHARERITSELALRTLGRLCENPPRILWHVRIVLLPVVNAAGRRLVEAGDSCRRGNAASVDPNRNFAWRWGVKDEGTRPDEEKPGPHPLSEPESRIIDGVAMAYSPICYVSFHSGGLGVITPWDDGGTGGNVEVKQVGGLVGRRHCSGCGVGNAAEMFGYRAYGTGGDHLHGVIGVPFVFTFEVYEMRDAGEEECEEMFNPVDAKEFDTVMRNWSGAVGTVAKEVVSLPRRDWAARKRVLAGGDVARWRVGYRVVFTEDAGVRMGDAGEGDLSRFVGAFVCGCVALALCTRRKRQRGRRR